MRDQSLRRRSRARISLCRGSAVPTLSQYESADHQSWNKYQHPPLGSMTTTNFSELLRVALRDLREGCRLIADRLPEVAAATSDPATRATFNRLIARSAERSGILAQMLSDPDGEPNLWAGGIMDDACRDVASTAAGRARDVALIGAVRKFLAADIVSLETAMALARHEATKKGEALEAFRQEACEMDHLLRQQLAELTRKSFEGGKVEKAF